MLNHADRFIQPESSAEQIRELEDLSSPVGAFIRDCCQIGPDHDVHADKLYEAWREWNDDQGYRNVSTVQTFGRDLRAAVPALTVTRPRDPIGRRYRVYHGVGLT
jgi:putative DNA primase/helicase